MRISMLRAGGLAVLVVVAVHAELASSQAAQAEQRAIVDRDTELGDSPRAVAERYVEGAPLFTDPMRTLAMELRYCGSAEARMTTTAACRWLVLAALLDTTSP